MEGVLASGAPFVWCLHIRRYDRIADGTLALTLKSTLDVASEREQSIDQISVREHDHTLDGQQPASPFLLIDQDTALSSNNGWLQRICGRESNDDSNGRGFLVHGNTSDQFCCFR